MSEYSTTEAQQILAEAVDWSMRLSQDELSAQDLLELTAWQERSPLHGKAWQKIQQLNGTFAALPTELARPVLNQSTSTGWLKQRPLLYLLACVPVLYLANQLNQQQQWGADYRSPVGAQKSITLPDGGELYLDSGAAIDVNFDAEKREIVLRKGQIWVKTAKDPQQRPFFVQTKHGQAQALGTEFAVNLEAQQSWLMVEHGAVQIKPKHAPDQGDAAPIIYANQQGIFNASNVTTVQGVDLARLSWKKGFMVVNNMPLSEFVQRLEKYQKGHISLDDAAAQITISGTYPIDDLNTLYEMLAQTYALQVDCYAQGYWVRIALKN